jgi:hypothetical protein
MKRFLPLLMMPVLMMVLAVPALAQESLPYTTNLIVDERNAEIDVGDFTVNVDGTMIFQIDESSTDWRLEGTSIYVSDSPPRGMMMRFRNQHTRLNGATSDVFNIDLSAIDRNGDGLVYVAAQAELVRQTRIGPRSRWPIFTARTTAWAQGDENVGRGRNQGTFFTVSVTPPTVAPGGPVG